MLFKKHFKKSQSKISANINVITKSLACSKSDLIFFTSLFQLATQPTYFLKKFPSLMDLLKIFIHKTYKVYETYFINS